MSTERVYSPENEPFDVTPNRAAYLRLELGWTKTPFERVPVPVESPAPVIDADEEIEVASTPAPARGRGRRRRAVEAMPATEVDTVDFPESWRS